MKILLLTDCEDSWSVHSICKTIKKQLPQHDIDIIAGDKTDVETLNYLIEKYNIIHFHYTAKITKFADAIEKWKEKMVITICNERSLLKGYNVDKVCLEQLISK